MKTRTLTHSFALTRADLQPDGSIQIAGVANDGNVTDSYGTRLTWHNADLEPFRSNPVLLFNHDPDNPVGLVDRIEVRENRVAVEATVHSSARTTTGASLVELVRDGVVRAFSVRFEFEKPAIRRDHYYEIEVSGLTELSVVTLPANKPSLFQIRRHLEAAGAATAESAELALRMAHDPQQLAALAADQRGDRAAGPLDFATLYSKLDTLFAEMPDGYYYCFAVYDDFCVAHRPYKGTYWKFPYSVDAQGNVILGDPVEVFMTWTEVPPAVPASGQPATPSPAALQSSLAQTARTALTPPTARPVAPASLEVVRQSLRDALKLPLANPDGRPA